MIQMKRNALIPKMQIFIFLLSFITGNAVFAQSETTPWWKDRPLRVYHPNMREIEVEDLDVKQFMADCKALHAEAIVFSTGGPYAFYNTKVPYHKKSPHMGYRDLLKEVVEEAEKEDIRVIARLDFSISNEEVLNEKPEWFFRDLEGNLSEKRSATGERFIRTDMLEGYRNEEVAIPILEEVCSKYDIAGVHLNAPGFRARKFRKETTDKFGIPGDPVALQRWREQRVAEQMLDYRKVIHEHRPGALFMAEINSPENPGWGSGRGFNHELLAGSYTNLLSTAGEPDDDEMYKLRWWTALSADWSHASNSALSGLPLINLKVGYQDGKLTLKPVSDYQLNCYQAIAHNAGIKAPSYGLMGNMPDPRTASMIAVPFAFMERCESFLQGAERITPVALVWPGNEGEGLDPGSYREGMLGLYRALVYEHQLFEIILAHLLKDDLSPTHHTVIVPSFQILRREHIEALQSFVARGGHLVIFDADPEAPIPDSWTGFMGLEQNGPAYECAYSVSADNASPQLPYGIMLDLQLRQVKPPREAEVWYYDSPSLFGGNFVPEVFPVLERGERPVLFTMEKGEGYITYFAGAFGSMMWARDLADYTQIFSQMIRHPEKHPLIEMDAPVTVNITAFQSGSKMVIHLLNGTGRIPLDEFVPVGPVNLKINKEMDGSCRWYVPGQETRALPAKRQEGSFTLSIEKLEGYGILVLD